METIRLKESRWRRHQQRLQKKNLRKTFAKKTGKYLLLGLLLILLGYGIDRQLGGAAGFFDWDKTFLGPQISKTPNVSKDESLNKNKLRSLLDASHFTNLKEKSFSCLADGETLQVETSLDLSLQNFLQQRMRPGTARCIAVVVMDPATGKILSMIGFDRDTPENNPCTESRFPAASIFKIVTAAAAIEKLNVDPESEFTFNGRKHTLYKSQLHEKTNKYTNHISLMDSFAQSVNPVFGKLGANYLGAEVLEEYASSFGFNRPIEFEIPVITSSASLSDEPYNWAEIASGFNRQTAISPLHGAILAAAIINGGWLMEPSIVDHVTDETGQILYRSHPRPISQVISPKASEKMDSLMKATITSGTAKNTFNRRRQDRVLSRLHIGGKTGSITDTDGEARLDWFVGYAKEKSGEAAIVISTIVAHEKYMGTRSTEYARMVMKHYFKDYFTKASTKNKDPQHS